MHYRTGESLIPAHSKSATESFLKDERDTRDGRIFQHVIEVARKSSTTHLPRQSESFNDLPSNIFTSKSGDGSQ